MTANTGILTSLLLTFKNAASLGSVALISPALSLAQIFITIEILFLGVYVALNAVDNIVVAGLKKIVLIGIFLYLIENFGYLSNLWFLSLGQAGITAGGGGITTNMLYDPSAILDFGFKCADNIFKETGGIFDILTNPLKSLFLGIGGVAVIISYFVIACNLMMLVIEFHIFTTCSVILLPWGILTHSKFITEGILSGCVQVGVKLMVLSFVMCLSYNTLQNLTIPTDPSIKEIMLVFCVCASIAWLSSSIPSKVASYIAGSPDLSSSMTTGKVVGGSIAGAIGARYASQKAYQATSKGVHQIKNLFAK